MCEKILAEYTEILRSSDEDVLLKYKLEKTHNFIDNLCPKCSSKEYMKNGVDLSQRGNRQRWICKKCGRNFRTAI